LIDHIVYDMLNHDVRPGSWGDFAKIRPRPRAHIVVPIKQTQTYQGFDEGERASYFSGIFSEAS